MGNALRNLTAFQLTRSRKPKGLVGKLTRNKLAKRIRTKRGPSAALAKAGISAQQAKIGLGALAGVAVVAASVVGLVKAINNNQDADESYRTSG